jgi:hypothetical protein
MITWKLHNITYTLPNYWEDWTPKMWMQLSDLIPPEGITERGTLLEEDLQFVGEILKRITGAPVDQMNPIEIETLWEMIRTKALGLWFWEIIDYQPVPMREYNWRGKTWTLPKPMLIAGETLVSLGVTTQQFIESAESLRAMRDNVDGIKWFPMLLSIYLRPKGEGEWNREAVIKDSEQFSELPMSIALDCFFFIREFYWKYILLSRSSLGVVAKEDRGRIGFGLLQIMVLWVMFLKWLRGISWKLLNGSIGRVNRIKKNIMN